MIATRWSVYDATSPEVAQWFHGGLRDLGSVDAAAHALHEAQLRARARYPSHVTVWAPYVHSGP